MVKKGNGVVHNVDKRVGEGEWSMVNSGAAGLEIKGELHEILLCSF
jgi:hypothetical protein